MKDLGILIVDMQPVFFDEEGSYLIENQKKLIKYAKQEKLPIFVLEYQKKLWGETLPELKKDLPKETVFIPKYNDNGFIFSGKTFKNVEFDKYKYLDPFYLESSLSGELLNKNINSIIYSGVNKRGCALNTFLGGLKRGYNFFTSEDLFNDLEKEVGEYHLYSNHFTNTDSLMRAISDL